MVLGPFGTRTFQDFGLRLRSAQLSVETLRPQPSCGLGFVGFVGFVGLVGFIGFIGSIGLIGFRVAVDNPSKP